MKQEITEIREEIDKLDRAIIESLDRRMDLVKTIGEIKKAGNLPIFDSKREEEILDKTGNAKNSSAIRKVFSAILEESKNLQKAEISCKKEIDIGIIGFGNFGKLAAKNLSKWARVIVTDFTDKRHEAKQIGVEFGSMDEVLKRKIIILAMPMENLEKTLIDIRDRLIPGTLVLDVCSLKKFSCELMQKILPKEIEAIGTHPLFGPQSAPDSLVGMKIVLCNITAKEDTLRKVKNFCESFGLEVFVASAEEHDRQMAFSQALVHFIGQVCKKQGIKRVELSTKTFDKFMDAVEIVKNDTPALFENMQTMNPFAGRIRNDFIKEAEKLNHELNAIRIK